MSERDALLKAVCDSPDDDTPRLVFADWLDEHGEAARAEFIRLQVARAVGGSDAPSDRERELLAAHRDVWVEPLKEYESPRGDYYEFRRGFVEGLAADADAMEEDGTRLFRLTPVRALYLNDAEEFGGLAKCKWLLKLHTLDLNGSGLSHHFDPAPLIKSRYLANLTTLGLGGEDDNGHLDRAGIDALLASKHLGKLETLDLSGNWLKEAFAHFVTATNLPSLRNLNLDGVWIGDAGATALATAPLTAQLRSLNLARNNVRAEGARIIAESPHLANLTHLDLQQNEPSHDGVEPITPETVRLLRERLGAGLVL